MALAKNEKERIVEELKRLKPASAKGIYIKGISISSTMGPGLKLNISELA